MPTPALAALDDAELAILIDALEHHQDPRPERHTLLVAARLEAHRRAHPSESRRRGTRQPGTPHHTTTNPDETRDTPWKAG